MSNRQAFVTGVKALVARAEAGGAVGSLLQTAFADVCRQIRRDATFPALLSLWGRCVNVDENVGEVIVHPAILEAIGQMAGRRMRGRVVHAGLQHTYGYLFSLIETPFGAKRDRWLSTDMERGLGIERSLLSYRPRAGTLLANATWLMGHIAFRDVPVLLRKLTKLSRAVAPELQNFDFTQLAPARLVETVNGVGPRRRQVRLITDLLPYPHARSERRQENSLLIYSVQTGGSVTRKLITAFPVSQQVVTELQASAATSGVAPTRPRYNAYVPGFGGKTRNGVRRFYGPTNQN